MKATRLFAPLIIFLLISISAPGQIRITNQNTQPGVVDLTVITALHPMMSLYDFNRMGFINVEFGLDAKTMHERRRALINLDEKKKRDLENELEPVNREYSVLKQKQFKLLNEMQTTHDEQKKQTLKILVDTHNQEINETWNKRNQIRFQLTNPDLMLPQQTRETLQRIEEEVLAAVSHVAEEKGLDLVLNISVPNQGRRNLQRSFEILTEKNLSFAETDLYYAFLANAKEQNEQPQEAEHLAGMLPEQNGAARWLEQSRQPAVQEQLPINPHPLVLKGGINITVEVVTRLLLQYKCDKQVITRLAEILKKKYTK